MNTEKRYFRLPKRNLPVIGEADVIVVGASLGGISAAIRAAKEGAKVFVVGYMPYPGEDLCGHYKYLFEYECPDCAHPLLDAIFPKDSIRTPFTVKKALENAMLENDIDFLYSSYVTEVLMDKENEPAGVVIVNRSGRQVIKGKTLIDATFEAYAHVLPSSFRTDREEEREEFFITVGNAYGEGGEKALAFSPKQNGRTSPFMSMFLSILSATGLTIGYVKSSKIFEEGYGIRTKWMRRTPCSISLSFNWRGKGLARTEALYLQRPLCRRSKIGFSC